MAVQAFTNIKSYVAGYDFTGDSNTATLQIDAAVLDKTTFGSNGWTEVAAGLRSTAFALGGFWQSDTDQAVDPQAFAALGASKAVTLTPTGVEGEVAYLFQAMGSQYALGGAVGDLAPFTLQTVGSDGQGAVRGALLKSRGTVSATGATGTGVQLGAVGATQYLYGAFHVFSAGTTVTVVLESDDNSGFTSATTRATFGPITTSGGTWATRVAGAITDDWYRLRITAITGSFIVAGSAGIK